MKPTLLLSSLILAALSWTSLSLVSSAQVLTEIRKANLPADLPSIQDCRRSAFAGKPCNLSSQKSFCNADQILKEGYICVIATASDGSVLGTADLNTRTKVVNNVYVRAEARKQGIANLMMEAVENELEAGSVLKLTVMSKNTPAVSLYKKLGFQTPGVYGGLDALSSVTPLDFLMEMEKKMT
ncbi:hypothetical protein ACHAWF_018324 [Thalassiosira exigua]